MTDLVLLKQKKKYTLYSMAWHESYHNNCITVFIIIIIISSSSSSSSMTMTRTIRITDNDNHHL
jgi:hypothetical protein